MTRDIVLRLADSRDFIAENFSTDISLAEAAQVATMSQFHFHRLFSDWYGQTPHEFRSQQRFDRAKQLLIEGNLSISEIAFELGYESPASFSHLFRKRFGLNPTQFRFQACRAYALGKIWGPKFIPHCFTSRSSFNKN